MTSTSEYILKGKDIVDLSKVNFCISKLLIQYNTGSFWVHITGGVNIYLCACKSIGPHVSCVFVSVCDIKSES